MGEQVSYTYHTQGALDSVTAGSATYVRRTIYDASGRVELRELGWNGSSPTLKVDYDYFAWNTPNGQGRLPHSLRQIKAGTPASPTSLLDLRYFSGTGDPAYDAVGNLLNIYDHKMGSPQTQSFTYDNLGRLTSASATGGSLGLYSESYTYNNDTGNLASKGGVSYYYEDPSHVHAVTRLGNGNTYGYDANGNMTQRNIGGVSYTLEYDAENRLSTVRLGATTIAAFSYDGDGVRVKGTLNGATTAYVGEILEWTGSTSSMVKYYYAGGTRVAMRNGTMLYWLIGDHLSSTSVVANSSGGLHSKILYKAWGEVRYASASLPTRYTYTGQYSYMDDPATPGVTEGFGLMFYRSRWYDPYITQFSQPDSIIPSDNGNYSPLIVDYHETKLLEQLNQENRKRLQDPGAKYPAAPTNPLAFNRYSYSYHNPLRYTDPDGHIAFLVPFLAGAVIGGAISTAMYALTAQATGQEITFAGAAGAFAGGAVAGAVSVIATPLAGTLLHAAGTAATGTALVAGTAAINAAGGAASYLAGGFTQNAVDSAMENTPTFQPTIGGMAVNAAVAGALSPMVGNRFPVANNTMSTLRQASYFMPGRTVPTLFATQNARNMYSQALVATGTGSLAGYGYSEWEQPR